MSKQLKEIKAILAGKSDAKNIAFFQKMVPGQQKIYGVKTPVLNEISKQYKEFSFVLAEELWNSGALEEKIIAIKIVEKCGKTDPQKVLTLFKTFSKTIDNWAVCDGMGMQFLRGIVKTERDAIFRIAAKFAGSRNFWQRRLALVMMEWYTRHSDDHAAIKEIVSRLENDDEYYVKKAVAWINRNFAKGK
jgi:3-methyladenine DNA glycosylase AlkD